MEGKPNQKKKELMITNDDIGDVDDSGDTAETDDGDIGDNSAFFVRFFFSGVIQELLELKGILSDTVLTFSIFKNNGLEQIKAF